MKLKISERFYSIQGEGRCIGTPAYFIRLAGCNLRCRFGEYVCDTIDVWKTTKEVIETFDLAQYLKMYEFTNTHIVITGGEPLLQYKAIEELINYNKSLFYELESNATIKVETYKLFNQINLSPKLESVGYGFEWYEERGIIDFWKRMLEDEELRKKTDFKFVLVKPSDIAEILLWENELDIDKKHIYLMPASITRKDLIENSKWVIHEAQNWSYKYSSRLQICIYDKTTGV